MNAITAALKADVWYAVDTVSTTPTTVENACNKKKIEMDVPKL
jgi:hypothetical protein